MMIMGRIWRTSMTSLGFKEREGQGVGEGEFFKEREDLI